MPGLTPKDHTILRLLQADGPSTSAEIGERLGYPAKVASAYVSRSLKRLRELELVEHNPETRTYKLKD